MAGAQSEPRRVRARRVDLVRDLARPIPARLMAAMLGLPREDDGRLQIWSDAALSLMGALPAREQIERCYALVAELPGAWERLRASPDEIPAFVEESLRLETPAKGNYRRTTRAVLLGGAALPEGATLALLWGSANRDEAEFPEPDRFELHRPNQKAQLGFGHGAHFCLGAAVARMETRIVLEELLACGASVRIASGPHRHVPSVFVRRLATLEAEVA